MRYAYVENGEVKRVGGLPRSFGNISGFNRLNATKLKERGFLPYEMTMPEYDEDTHKLGERKYNIKANKVEATYEVVAMSSNESDKRKESFNKDCDNLILKHLYNTDWTELAGLDQVDENKFSNLRSLLNTCRDNLDKKSLSDLRVLRDKLAACNECLASRKVEFTQEVNELVTHLEE